MQKDFWRFDLRLPCNTEGVQNWPVSQTDLIFVVQADKTLALVDPRNVYLSNRGEQLSDVVWLPRRRELDMEDMRSARTEVRSGQVQVRDVVTAHEEDLRSVSNRDEVIERTRMRHELRQATVSMSSSKQSNHQQSAHCPLKCRTL